MRPRIAAAVVGCVVCLASGLGSMSVAQSGALSSSMSSGQALTAGQQLVSPNGLYSFTMQTDGNLVVSFSGRALWSSSTAGDSGSSVVMQPDGDLVVRSATGRDLWASRTQHNPGADLVIQDDGNVVIYTSGGQARWATNTGAPQPTRVMVVGDSVALTLGGGIERWGAAHGVYVLNAGALGCTLLYDATVRGYWGVAYRPHDPCQTEQNWANVLPRFLPDVVVVLFGAWDVYDASWDNGTTWFLPGDGVWDTHYFTHMLTAASQLASTGAGVLWLDPPCFAALGAPDQTAPWLDPARPAALGHVIGDVATINPIMVSSVVHNTGCPVDFSTRPDGVHYSDAGADTVAQLLVPEIDAAARVRATYTANYSDAQYALLQKAGQFFHISTDHLPKTGVAVLAYTIAISHAAPAHLVPPPENTGTHAISAARDPNSAGAIRTVTEHFDINGDQAHYLGGTFMIYIWALLGGH